MKTYLSCAGFILAILVGLQIGDPKNAGAQDGDLRKELDAAFQKGSALRAQGKFADAIPYLEKAAALAPKVFGDDHLNTAAIMNTTGSTCYSAGRFKEAESHFRRSLEIREAKLPKDHDQVLASIANLGLALDGLGRSQEAVEYLTRCLNLQEAKLPKNHPDLALTLHNLGGCVIKLGDYDRTEKIWQRCLDIRVANRGKDHLEVAASLHSLSELYRVMEMHKEAEAAARRSMEIRLPKLGKDHIDVAYNLNVLGSLYYSQARFKEAEAMLRRALEIREARLGKVHPMIATSLNNLALLYTNMERFGEAETLFRRSLEMRELIYGKDHPELGNVLCNLAVLMQGLGRHDEAEKLYVRSLQIREAKLDKNHPDLAVSLNNLALHYENRGRTKEVEPLLRRALAIEEARFGKNHVNITATLNNLAHVHMRLGQLKEAHTLLMRCWQIRSAHHGKDHPNVAFSLASLGNVNWRMGNLDKADDYFRQSLEFFDQRSDLDNLTRADFLKNRAALKQAMNQPEQALKMQEEAMRIHQLKVRDVFAFSSESAMGAYMETLNDLLPAVISMAAQKDSDVATVESALTWNFRLKGAIFDSLCQYRQAELLLPKDDALQQRVVRYRSQKEYLANVAVNPPTGVSPDRIKKLVGDAEQEVAELEKEIRVALAKKAPDAIAGRESVTMAQVQKRLPADGALIEFCRMPVRDFKKRSVTELRYLAFVLTPGKKAPRLIDLGPIKAIDEGVEDLRKEFADFQDKLRDCETAEEAQALEKTQEKEFAKKSAALYARLFAPLREELGQAKLLYLAPEGPLNRLPFEALGAPDGKYLVEHYRCAYLSNGRDLMRTPGKLAKGTVVFAAPDYKLDADQRLAQAEKLLDKKAPTVAPGTLSKPTLRSAGWKNLPGAAAEAKDLKKILHQGKYGPVKTYVGAEALEEVLKAMPAPRILHLATHGFFLDREPATSEPAEDGAGAGWARGRLKRMDNPLLRSGIVLAGANTIGDKESTARVDDGWVTAEEISLLNLHGTELVVLSACQTGLGDIKSGEGVHGLRRAFLYAGAQTLLTSLFEVPDNETRELMRRFYTNFEAGQGKLRALHTAQRSFIDERRQMQGAAHPFFWASFVLVGNAD